MNMNDIRKRLRDPDSRVQAAIEFGDYFRDLCLMFGSELETAGKVGYVITIGLVKEFEKRESGKGVTR